MENNFKIRIDEIVEDLGKIQDLNIKIDILNYMEQQAAFLLWTRRNGLTRTCATSEITSGAPQ